MSTPSRASAFTFLALGIASPSFAAPAAQATPGPRRVEPVDHPEIQRELAARHAGFQSFLARTEGPWFARFDEESGAPDSIIGRGLPLDGGRVSRLDGAAAHARAVLESFPELWGAPLDQLELADAVHVPPLFVFTFQQRWRGLEVRGARVQIQVHEAGRVASL